MLMMACRSASDDIIGLRYTFRKSWYVPRVSSVCVEPTLACTLIAVGVCDGTVILQLL